MIWHKSAMDGFIEAVLAQTVPHAWCVNAPYGCGGEAFVWQMALALLCHQPQGGLACGQCQSCQLVEQKSHPDCYVLSDMPVKIDIIRDCQAKIMQTGQISATKVVMITQAHTLTDTAAASLLKIMEEPPEATYFILLTERQHLLATVHSRCRRVSIQPPSREQALAWLAQHITVTDETQRLLDVYANAPQAVLDSVGWDFFQGLCTELDALVNNMSSITQLSEKYEKCDFNDLFIGLFYYLQRRLQALNSAQHKQAVTAFWDYCLQKRRNLHNVATLNKRLLVEALLGSWHAFCQHEAA